MFDRRKKQQDENQHDDSTMFTVPGGFKPMQQQQQHHGQQDNEGRGKQKNGFNPWCQRSWTKLKQTENSFRSSVNEIRATEIEGLGEEDQPQSPRTRRRSLRDMFSRLRQGSSRKSMEA